MSRGIRTQALILTLLNPAKVPKSFKMFAAQLCPKSELDFVQFHLLLSTYLLRTIERTNILLAWVHFYEKAECGKVTGSYIVGFNEISNEPLSIRVTPIGGATRKYSLTFVRGREVSLCR